MLHGARDGRDRQSEELLRPVEHGSTAVMVPPSPPTSPEAGLENGAGVVRELPVRERMSSLGRTMLFATFTIALLAVTIACMAVAGARWDAYCETPMIRVFLMVHGIVSFLLMGFLLREYYIDRKRGPLRLQGRDYRPPFARLFTFASVVTFGFWFLWFLVGNYFVYSLPAKVDHVNCDPTLFLFAFGYLTTVWLVLSISCVWTCIIGVVTSRRRRRAVPQLDDDDHEAALTLHQGQQSPGMR